MGESNRSADDILKLYFSQLRDINASYQQNTWTEPPAPPEPPTSKDYRLRLEDYALLNRPTYTDLDKVRDLMVNLSLSYYSDNSKKVQLLKVGAGVGKTHSMVDVAQRVAQTGGRVLWLAPFTDLFEDMKEKINIFDRSLWYKFQPINENSCRYHKEQACYQNKGYKSIDLCKAVCRDDGWIEQCPYRNQISNHHPIVFGAHPYLVTGLMISNFDLTIIDELPLNQFCTKRQIATAAIDIGARGPLRQLTDELMRLAYSLKKNEWLTGRKLMQKIGPILQNVWAQIEIEPEHKIIPHKPYLYQPSDVEKLPFWYIFDLLKLLMPEYHAWKNEWNDWAERVRVNYQGLLMMEREKVWSDLSKKVITIDASGYKELYENLLDREVDIYEPLIKRKGKIVQYAYSMNGITALSKREENLDSEDGFENIPTVKAMEALAVAKSIATKYLVGKVGVITHLKNVDIFAREFGRHNVLHFYGLRGSNKLQDLDCLIIVGSPAVDYISIVDQAVSLYPKRIKSFLKRDDEGKILMNYTFRDTPFNVTQECYEVLGNKLPVRLLGGYHNDPELQRIYAMHREDELVQAIHRARINVRECDVYLLNATPTSEPIDEIYAEPQIGPQGIHWRNWLKIQDYLDTQFENGGEVKTTDLAELTNCAEGYVVKNKWLDIIRTYQADRWETGSIKSTRRGKPKRVLYGIRTGY